MSHITITVSLDDGTTMTVVEEFGQEGNPRFRYAQTRGCIRVAEDKILKSIEAMYGRMIDSPRKIKDTPQA